MSKAAKRRAQQQKLKLKSKNQIRKQRYEAMAGGKKKETRSAKRSRLKAQRTKTVRTTNHQAGEGPRCYNIGCKRCFPELNKPKSYYGQK
ncbi:hypothetical protein CMI47_12980 [Candidatus Pacearchaeota archaeon]|nr:hypothetical protein [Candidatus Pacearchaeota archaeon]|tara:strand:- start:785 stop:1054 length:270 start_codon:yes stop_codon:yes gene_type:complete